MQAVSDMKGTERILILCLLVTSIVTALPGCGSLAKVKEIKVTSCGVESYSMKGLRSLDAVLAIGIDNPAMEFTVNELDGILKYHGEDFAFFSADTVTVDARCSKVYDLPCTATLREGIGLLQAMQIAGKGSLEGFTADIEAKVKIKKGPRKTVRFKDLDLQELAEK